MQHQRHPHRFPCATGYLGAIRSGSRRQLAADHVREQHTGAFEQIALLDDSRDATATFVARPDIGAEWIPVERFESRDDARLKIEKVGFDLAGILWGFHFVAEVP